MMQENFYLRVRFVWYLFLFLYAIILLRLFQLQVDQKYFLAQKAQQQYQQVLAIPASRGIIYDRHGKKLVFNDQTWDICLIPAQKKIDGVTKKYLEIEYPALYTKAKADQWEHFFWVERQVSEIKKNQMLSIGKAFVAFPSSRRLYPYPHCNHLLGFVTIDGDGGSGIELSCNEALKGINGSIVGFAHAKKKRQFFETFSDVMPIPGKDIIVTIDESLQRIAYEAVVEKVEALHAQEGAALIMDPTTGEVLAMVSYPNFLPHQISAESLSQMHNIPVESAFEAGSVLKTFLALAALAEGVVTVDTEIDCEGRQAMIGGMLVQYPATMGPEMGIASFSKVIQKSNNIGVAKVAMHLSTKLYDHYKKIGFGSKTKLQLPAEQAGFLRSPDKWTESSPVALSFGYEVSVTLLQLARAFSMIASGGLIKNPTVIKQEVLNEAVKIYEPDVIDALKTILEPIGALYGIPGYTVYGKTGTARLLKDGVYSSEHHLYMFAGIVEKDIYKRVIITMVKEPKEVSHLFASQITAPLFKTIVQRMVVVENGI
jgi:cell division protein FtsI (penicillin-binding protein 3)